MAVAQQAIRKKTQTGAQTNSQTSSAVNSAASSALGVLKTAVSDAAAKKSAQQTAVKNALSKTSSSGSASSSGKTTSYDPSVDYMAKINEAKQAGDLASAARYEELRNQKIADMNAQGTNSGGYTGSTTYIDIAGDPEKSALWDIATDKNDYAALANQAYAGGAFDLAAQYEEMRNRKIDAMNALGMNPNGYTQTSMYAGMKKPEAVVTPDYLTDLYDRMQALQNQKIDYTVQQGIAELERAQEDAQAGFIDQMNKTNIDEARARDNQVLYAAARGDRGGITARQYDAISNTAANNRAAIQEQRQKLATDTARQIADLRAQGEFQKAEALLEIAQQQLAQMWQMQEYQDQQYFAEQELKLQQAGLTGMYNGQQTQASKQWEYEIQQNEREWAYELAMQAIQAGITPDDATIQAAGLDKSMVSQMAAAYKAAATAKASSGSSGSGGGKTGSSNPAVGTPKQSLFQQMYMQGVNDYETAYAYLSLHDANLTDSQIENNAVNFVNWLKNQEAANTPDESDLGTYVDGTFVTWDDLETFVNRGAVQEYTKGGKSYYSWTNSSYSY